MGVEIAFEEIQGLDGVVTIRADGQPELELTDDPHHQLRHLARAFAELAGGAPVVQIPYWSMPGGYQLTADGDAVVVSGDYIDAPARLPRDELGRAVIAATQRWLARAAAIDDDAHRGLVQMVTEALAAARTSLSA